MDIKEILAKVDHTLLAQDATWDQIRAICDDGMKYATASVCIPASYVKQAKDYVGDRLAICTVIGFPNGYSTTAVKCFETVDAVNNGADEIDMVINIGMLKDGQDEDVNVVIVDECQFLTEAQIDQLRELVDEKNVSVMCFGLRTDFQTKLFPGSRRLLEVADEITEIKTMCECGKKATVNARIDGEGYVVTEGAQVFLGGNDSYIAMCHRCWRHAILEHRKVKS